MFIVKWKQRLFYSENWKSYNFKHIWREPDMNRKRMLLMKKALGYYEQLSIISMKKQILFVPAPMALFHFLVILSVL